MKTRLTRDGRLPMRSCLYECQTTHRRFTPKPYGFSQKFFMFYLDLDELDEIADKGALFVRNRPGIYEFRDSDHMLLGHRTVKENILQYLKQNYVPSKIGKIMLLTHLRTLGYIFNPLSVYFCFDESDKPICAVAEVGNTFGEMKPFFLGKETLQGNQFLDRQKKFFYISPFIDLDAELDFKVEIPAESLSIRVDDWKEKERFFTAVLSGRKVPMNAKNICLNTLKYPFVTLQVITMIHWHAWMLYLKKLPFYEKERCPELQKNVQRAWIKK